MVGPDGQVLAEAGNTVVASGDCTGHAELNLIRMASVQFDRGLLRTSTLYASTEPCPMCAGAIHWCDIQRVVFGCSMPRLYELTADVASAGDRPLPLRCRQVLSAGGEGIDVIGPALEEEAERVHEGFWGRT